MRFEPHDYQQRAIGWIEDHRRCCLFLEMGLGKTVCTLTALQHMTRYGETERSLVLAPRKVAESTWGSEADKWDHLRGLRVVTVTGTAPQRLRALQSQADVYVMSRDSAAWLVNQQLGRFDCVVLDELTAFKSGKSQRHKAARRLCDAADRVIGLTGTPAPNTLIDLWGQMRCVDGGQRLGMSVTRYRERYFNVVLWNHIPIKCVPKVGAREILQHLLGDICLTMRAADYLELPALLTHRVDVRLSASQLRAYSKFERERVLEFEAGRKGDEPASVLAANAAALLNKLSQYANGAIYDQEGQTHVLHDEKVNALLELVEAAPTPVLVFYQYRSDAERIGRAIGDRWTWRQYGGADDLTAWNAGKVRVLLAHPASTAFGLNMQQGGRYIVWFGTGWNLELYQQANARLHRQGQTGAVHVYHLVCTGTVDERALDALEGKKTTQATFLSAMSALCAKYGESGVKA